MPKYQLEARGGGIAAILLGITTAIYFRSDLLAVGIGLLVFVVGVSLTTLGFAGVPKILIEKEEENRKKEAWQLSLSGMGIVVALALVLWASSSKDTFWLAIFTGAIGGLAHEIAQSKGKFFFPDTQKDGVYLGGLSGLVLGGVAGLLILAQTKPGDTQALIIAAFSAGLSLKGISEAAASNPQGKEKPSQDKQEDRPNK